MLLTNCLSTRNHFVPTPGFFAEHVGGFGVCAGNRALVVRYELGCMLPTAAVQRAGVALLQGAQRAILPSCPEVAFVCVRAREHGQGMAGECNTTNCSQEAG